MNNDVSNPETSNGLHPNLATRLQRRANNRERQVHRQLQADLMEHIWELFGHEHNEV